MLLFSIKEIISRIEDPILKDRAVQLIGQLGPVISHEATGQGYWSGHCFRVACLVAMTALAMDLPWDLCVWYGSSAFLHDWGKTDPEVEQLFSHKSIERTFTPQERELANTHTYKGAKIARERLGMVDPKILWHIYAGQITHDIPFTGSILNELSAQILFRGSEIREISGKKIPLSGRLIKVADTFDAMVSGERPYQPKWTQQHAIFELYANAGRVYDPEIVEVFSEKVIRAPKPGRLALSLYWPITKAKVIAVHRIKKLRTKAETVDIQGL